MSPSVVKNEATVHFMLKALINDVIIAETSFIVSCFSILKKIKEEPLRNLREKKLGSISFICLIGVVDYIFI